MKRGLSSAVLLLLFFLTACASDSDPSFTPSPSGSRAPYFNEVFSPSPDEPLYAVTVNRVLEHRHDFAGYDSLVFQATVIEDFSAPLSGGGLSPGTEILVGVGISDLCPFTTITEEELNQSAAQLRQIIEQSDSLIVHGRTVEPVIVTGTEEYDLWLADTKETNWNTKPYGEMICLDLGPSIRLTGLNGWQLLPFRDGVLNGKPLEELIDSVGSSMTFDLDQTNPQGGQYFKNGDPTAEVYDAMREFTRS